MCTYLNSGLNLRELLAAIDVSLGNKKSVDTNDGQTLLSKVEEPISCEGLNPYGRFTTKKHVFTEGNQSHHPTRDTRMLLYH